MKTGSVPPPKRPRRIPRLAAVVVAAAVLSWAVLATVERFWPESGWKARQLALQDRYDVAILLSDIGFPPSFRAQNARYRLTLRFERSSVLDRLAVDLARYPPDFVRNHLKELVVLRSLELNGLPYGGTYDFAAGRIYLDSDWLGDDGSGPEAMGLHHEFSSLLIRRHPGVFRAPDWTALNPPGFRYRFAASSAANLRTDQLDLVGNPEMWEQGFLCGYGRLTLEDDINTFAQYLVAGKRRWPELADRYPRLAAKMNLLASWYRQVGFDRRD